MSAVKGDFRTYPGDYFKLVLEHVYGVIINSKLDFLNLTLLTNLLQIQVILH